jgi:pimeloyl-ACP methyl ester carboxylesterase
MTTFVLVHGGGHGGWCWQRVARLLRADGHDVHTPTLTGFGDRVHLVPPGGEVPFPTFVTDVVNVLEFEDLHDAVLVGHSMGGVIVPRVAEAAPDRLARVVWLAGPVLADGETLIESIPQTPAIARAVTIAPDGTLTTDVEALLAAILSDGTEADRRWVAERHRPYPHAALVEPGRLTAFLALGCPAAYVLAARDETIPPDRARRFAARLPGAPVFEVDASHDAMVSRPAETAAALLAAAG